MKQRTVMSVYLQPDLYRAAKRFELNVSRILQTVIRAEVEKREGESLRAIDQAYADRRIPPW